MSDSEKAYRGGDDLAVRFVRRGSCDIRLGGGRVRLSCDVPWQRAGEPRDGRWFGAPPAGHGNLSYGGLKGARPLGAPYLAR